MRNVVAFAISFTKIYNLKDYKYLKKLKDLVIDN